MLHLFSSVKVSAAKVPFTKQTNIWKYSLYFFININIKIQSADSKLFDCSVTESNWTFYYIPIYIEKRRIMLADQPDLD